MKQRTGVPHEFGRIDPQLRQDSVGKLGDSAAAHTGELGDGGWEGRESSAIRDGRGEREREEGRGGGDGRRERERERDRGRDGARASKRCRERERERRGCGAVVVGEESRGHFRGSARLAHGRRGCGAVRVGEVGCLVLSLRVGSVPVYCAGVVFVCSFPRALTSTW